jgi:hypothetical protein
MKTKLHRSLVAAAAVAMGVALSGCGGGGDSGSSQCGGSAKLELLPTYEIASKSYSSAQPIVLLKGVPFDARVVVAGLPNACLSQTTIKAKAVTDIPAGLGIEEATGRVSGTPTVGRSMRVDVTVSVSGYAGSIKESFDFLFL